MNQAQCWMWTKRKCSNNLTSPSSYDDSWEEQAFAEDAAGSLGGCVWPPRSYTCSFCRREFRSAQALGGHMNVHRRDRARLKQPLSPQKEILYHDHNPVQTPFSSLGFLYPSPVCGFAYKSTSNPNSDPAVLASPSFPSPSKPLAPPVIENFREETLIPTFNSSIPHGQKTDSSPVHSSKSWSNLAEDRLYSRNSNTEEADTEKISKILDCGCLEKGENGKTDVAVSLNLVVCRAHSPVEFQNMKAAAAMISCKKRRTETSSSIPFFPISNSVDRNHMQSQVFEFSPSSIEELDLELRLGQRPKV